jgi:hypothetical protein
VLSKFWNLYEVWEIWYPLALFGPLKQMPLDIDFFVDLHDGRTIHTVELMFWDQHQNPPGKIIKNSG